MNQFITFKIPGYRKSASSVVSEEMIDDKDRLSEKAIYNAK